MKYIKDRILYYLLIFINMVVFAVVMEKAYFISDFHFPTVVLYSLLPVLLIIGLFGILKEEDHRLPYMVLAILAIIPIIYLVKDLDYEVLDKSIGEINSALTFDGPLDFEMFVPLLKILIMGGSLLLSVTVSIFPFNLIIVDTGIIFFLWAVDYYNQAEEHIRMFLPVWVFSVLLYRSSMHDAETRNLRVNKRMRFLQVAVMSLMVILTMSFVDLEKKGVYADRIWSYVNDILVPTLYIDGSVIDDPYTLASSGYNDSESQLGGNVSINNTVVLNARGDEAIYLRGSVKTSYTGYSWTKDYIGYEAGGRIENERINVLNLITAGSNKAVKSLELLPVSDMTSTLFNNIYSREVYFSNNLSRVFFNRDYQVFTSNRTTSEDYYVNYYDEATVRTYLMTRAFRNPTRNRNFKYLTIPDTVPRRVQDLVDSLVDFDDSNIEKARKLTDYLKTNFEYSLRPGPTPRSRDFIDYFLYSSKIGYCVHFGTALTIMLRLAGVPSRYVEGFKMSEEKNAEGEFVIRNSDAHAWTEVLVDEENDLWITFDATGTPREQENPDIVPGTPGPTDPGEVTPGTNVPVPTLPGGDNEPEDPESPTGNGSQADSVSYGRYALILALAILFLMLLVKRIRLEIAFHSKSLRSFHGIVVGALDDAYEYRKKGETDLEFASRIHDRNIRETFLKLTNETYREVYGGGKGEFPKRRQFYDTIYRRVRRLRGLPYYVLKRYLV